MIEEQLELFPDRFASRGELNMMRRGRGSASRRMTAKGKIVYDRPAGYAAKPGSGPAGETCRGCAHAVNRDGYWKCVLLRARWTSGPGSDIRLKSPACARWEKITTKPSDIKPCAERPAHNPAEPKQDCGAPRP